MELEFDKEIDAILRKARVGEAAAIAAPSSPHVDADAIAAFAESALPEKAKRLYMEHFADCDRCRRMLSQSILLLSEADAPAAVFESVPAIAPTVAAPWYERIFKTPSLALVMGALVLSFSGILGYLAIERSSTPQADVAMTANKGRLSGPNFNPDDAVPSAAANAPAAAPATNAMPSANMAGPQSVSNASTSNSRGPAANSPVTGESLKSADAMKDADNPVLAESKPIASAPSTAGQPAPVDDVRKREDQPKEVQTDGVASKTDTSNDERAVRDVTKLAQKKVGGGPSRGAGNVQQEANVFNQNVFENTAKREAGGKVFNQRNGVWYDTAYHGQAVKTYKRGSDDYKKLDSGLRSIADAIGGSVVIVWKESAYRIQ